MHRSLLTVALCAALGAAPVARAANLLANPGFEAGYDAWVTTGDPDLRHADPPPFEGANYAFAAANAHYTLQQDVDLIAAGVLAAAIDAGKVMVRFGGWQAGFDTQTDEGQIRLHLLGAAADELAVVALPYFHSNMTWVEQAGQATLLPGTRSVRFFFDGVRHAGSNNDAYLDAAFVEAAPVPVPTSLSLAFTSLATLVLFGRRARSAAAGKAPRA